MATKRPRKATRTGKKLDKATGKIAVPLVKHGEGGKIVATTPEERSAAVRTELPPAKLESIGAITPKPRNAERGMGVAPVKKGFAAGYPKVKTAVDAAMHHLTGLMSAAPGSEEHTTHRGAFEGIHENIRAMSPELHATLGQAYHQVLHPTPQLQQHLAGIHKAIQARLAIGKAAHEDRLARAQQGQGGQ
jgi:hypothetical protein